MITQIALLHSLCEGTHFLPTLSHALCFNELFYQGYFFIFYLYFVKPSG